MTRRHLALVVALTLALALAAGLTARAAQMIVTSDGITRAAPPPAGTGLILGRVVEDDTGRPIAGAVVTASVEIAGGATNYEPVMTDDQGRFVLRDLGAVRVTLRAAKPGYIAGLVGKAWPDDRLDRGQPLALGDGARIGDLTITMWRHAAITGMVTDESGEPIVGASVRALPRRIVAGRPQYALESAGPAETTDDRGVYRISGLAPGDYVVAAPVVSTTTPRTEFRAPVTGRGRATSVPASRWLASLGGGGGGPGSGVDTGDERTVLAVRSSSRGGGGSAGWAGMTPDGRVLIHETQFYAGTPLLSRASVVTLASGEERRGIDFRMRAVPASSVSGIVTGADGPAPDFVLRLVHAETSLMSGDPEIAQTTSDRDGRFTFLGVPPGQYVVRTSRLPQPTRVTVVSGTGVQTGRGGGGGVIIFSNSGGLPDDPTLWAETPVSVGDRDVRDVSLTLRAGARLTGRLVFEGTAPRPAAVNLPIVVVDPVGGATHFPAWQRAYIDQELRVMSYGLQPGRYLVRMRYPASGWRLKSVVSGGRDVSIVPIEVGAADVTGLVVTLTDQPISELSGRVTNARGEPHAQATVLVFPVHPERWTDNGTTPRDLRSIRVSRDGRFEIEDLPPGEYFAAAIARPSAAWAAEASLRALSRVATRLTIAERDRKSIELRVVTASAAGRGSPPAPEELPNQPMDGQLEWPLCGGLAPEPLDLWKTGPSPQAASVSGVVVTDEAMLKPVRRAVVSLGQRIVITDDQGRFAFTGLAAGRVSLSASKPAYISTSYGATRAGGQGTPIVLAEGQQLAGITLRMPRGAVITGTLRDERGQPAAEVFVRLYQFRYVNGVRQLGSVPIGPTGNARTDDRGAYRLFGLPPGEYALGADVSTLAESVRVTTPADIQAATRVLQTGGATARIASAGVPSARTVTYAPVLYPGVTDVADARFIRIAAGEERAGIDFAMRLVPTATIEATVTNPGGAMPQNVEARMVRVSDSAPSGGNIFGNLPTRPDDAGRVVFKGVPPGEFAVMAYSAGPPASDGGAAGARVLEPVGVNLWARADVVVNGNDVSGLSLVLQPGMTVSGTVRFDGTTAPPPATIAGLRVSLRSILTGAQVSVGQLSASTDAQGAFTIVGVMPGRYQASVSGSTVSATSGWTVRSALIGGIDALDRPFEVRPGENASGLTVTFTDRQTEISGSLQDTAGRPAPEYFVVLFPVDKTLWPALLRMREARPASDGRFTFARLKAGEYFIAALTDLGPTDLQDPEFLEQLVPAAIRVTVAEGEKKVQDLRIGR